MARYRVWFALVFLSALTCSVSPLAVSQTTPRTSGRPAPSTTQGAASASKQKTDAKATPKATTGKSPTSGQSTPIPSTSKQKSSSAADDDAPRTATRPNASTRISDLPTKDSKSTAPRSNANPNQGEINPLPNPVRPSWDPVPPEEVKYIDEVLKYWQASTDKIKTYRCDFKKFTYNPNFAPPNEYYEYSTGVIMYSQPDKGMYRVDEIFRYRPPKEPKDNKHPKAEGEKGEHWICDGEAVYYFDHLNKVLRKTVLPPIMQGKAIADGPLPFVFGAKAEKIKQRYWLHALPSKESDNEIRLAAVPKTREDAANYKEILIIIDYDSYLPKAMTVFMPNYDAKLNPAKETYIFSKREENIAAALWEKLQGEFFEPKTPGGWKLEVQEVPREEDLRTAQSKSTVPPAANQRKPATGNSKP
jgi:TIGR03009 family protein